MPTDYVSSLTRAINKATDATLLQDNWQYILDVCDKITEEPEEGTREAVKLIGERLQQRDANVQLRTLSLLTSVAENCGSRIKQEIATKSFTGILLGKLRDLHVHSEIKIKVVQVIKQLSDSFKKDPSLKPIQDAYREVQRDFGNYFPPNKPQKQSISERDRLKEEEDLKAAIAASLQESQALGPSQEFPAPQQAPSEQQLQQPSGAVPPQGHEQVNFSRVRALYDSFSEDPADLKFRKGDIITVIERVYKDWGKGSLRGVVGLFPFNYVTPLYDPTPAEIAKEIETENQILSKARQVEKLLALLTSAQSPEEGFRLTNSDEFRQLYQEIALIKPELATLIDKYRQRKDDLLDLHKKLKDASVIYEDLTDPLKYQYQQKQYYPPPQQAIDQYVNSSIQQKSYESPATSSIPSQHQASQPSNQFLNSSVGQRQFSTSTVSGSTNPPIPHQTPQNQPLPHIGQQLYHQQSYQQQSPSQYQQHLPQQPQSPRVTYQPQIAQHSGQSQQYNYQREPFSQQYQQVSPQTANIHPAQTTTSSASHAPYPH